MTKSSTATARRVRVYRVQADDEILPIKARSIFEAFRIAREMRPSVCVVSDTRKASRIQSW